MIGRIKKLERTVYNDKEIVVMIEEDNGELFYMNGERVPDEVLKEWQSNKNNVIIIDNIPDDE